ERVGGPRVDVERAGDRLDVVDLVERHRRRRDHLEEAAALADHRLDVDADELALAVGAEPQRLARRRADAAVELLAVAVVDAPHGPAGAARELGRDDTLLARALLGAEAAADELGDDAHALDRDAEAARVLVA